MINQATSGDQELRPPKNPMISVVIVNYNAGKWLAQCLAALAAQTFTDFEAIIIDNGSSDGSMAGLNLPDARFRTHEAGRNLGFAAANNLGAGLACGAWLATLNPDAFPEPGWLAELFTASRRNPDAAMLGSTQLLHANPAVLDGVGDCLSFSGFAWRGGYGRDASHLPPEGEVFSPCAAAALYRMKDFRAAGGFREQFFCYNEDVELGFHLRVLGHRAVQVPGAMVRHVSSGISRRESNFSTYHGHRNGLWAHIINMPSALLWLTLPAHAAGELALLTIKLGQSLIGPGKAEKLALARAMARGFWHGWRDGAWAWRERSRVQGARQASLHELVSSLVWSPLPLLRKSPCVKPSPGFAPDPPHPPYLRSLANKTLSWARVAKRALKLAARGHLWESWRHLTILAAGGVRLFQHGAAVYYKPPIAGAPAPAPALPRVQVLSEPPPSCLIVSCNLNQEGAPSSQLELTLALRQRGVIEPIILSPLNGPLRREYDSAGVKVMVEPGLCQWPRTERDYLADQERLRAVISRARARMVYANTALSYYAVDAARQMSLPTLWNIRESEDWRTYFDFLPATVARRALACFAYPRVVVFVSRASARVWAPLCPAGRVRVIHTGIDLSKFQARLQGISRGEARGSLGLADKELAILLMGVVAPHKGQRDLPLALVSLAPQVLARLRCFVVGDRPGPYSRSLNRLLGKMEGRLAGRVMLIPETPEVANYYRAADIFVSTSRVDTYPRTILEAMACGLPIVTTPVCGIREQVTPGVNGLFYTPGRPRELARALTALVEQPRLRASLGDKQAGAVETLPSYDDMVGDYADLFRQLDGG